MFGDEEGKFTKIYFDENMSVSSGALAKARVRGITTDLKTYLTERRISLAIDCSRFTDQESLRFQQGRIAEITELLGLFLPME